MDRRSCWNLILAITLCGTFLHFASGHANGGGKGSLGRDAVSCNCVAFRLDGVQDYAFSEALRQILDVFGQDATPLTAGIVAGNFGSDIKIGGKIRDITRNESWEVEIASEGFTFEDYTLLNYQSQFDKINQSKYRIESSLVLPPLKTFIPPLNKMNNVTLQALEALGFTHISASFVNDQGPYSLTGRSFYHFPSGTSSSYAFNETVYPAIQSLISQRGFAVVTLNPQDFSIDDDNVDAYMIDDLRVLLRMVRIAGIRIVPIGRINLDSSNVTLSGAISSGVVNPNQSCNCVAFRLDDIQDYFCRPAQVAIMELFREYGIPLSIGIIGNYFINDYEIVNYVQGALADPCWKVELFNHGFIHEDFSPLNYSVAYGLLNASQHLIHDRLGIWPRTFVPPFNSFNSDTISACVDLNFTHFSSQIQLDPPPYGFKDNLWRFPMGSHTDKAENEEFFEGVPHNVTFLQLTEQLRFYGYSVVMIHPQEFSERSGNAYTNVLNMTMIDELRALLDLVMQHPEIRPCLITEIDGLFGKSSQSTTGAACVPPPFTSTAAQTVDDDEDEEDFSWGNSLLPSLFVLLTGFLW